MKKFALIAVLISLSVLTNRAVAWAMHPKTAIARVPSKPKIVRSTDTEDVYSDGLVVTHFLSELTEIEPTIKPACLLDVSSDGAQYFGGVQGGYCQFVWTLVCGGSGTNMCTALCVMTIYRWDSDFSQWEELRVVNAFNDIHCSANATWYTGVSEICSGFGSGEYLVTGICGTVQQNVIFTCE